MNFNSRFIVILMLGMGLMLVGTTLHARTLVCESSDRQTRRCPVDTRGGVHLSVQFSEASCRQGSTWGYDRRAVWVANGCRARFDIGASQSSYSSNNDSDRAALLALTLIGAVVSASNNDNDRDRRGRRDRYDYRPGDRYQNYGPSQRITCESEDGRRQFCSVNLRRSKVDIDRQLSNTTCRYGDNWGWNRRGIWVSKGCRAVFAVY